MLTGSAADRRYRIHLMELAFRAISAATIPTLYRLGERSPRVRAAPRVRSTILRTLERLSRGKAARARAAFERSGTSPEYLEPAELDGLVARFSRINPRADRRLPHE